MIFLVPALVLFGYIYLQIPFMQKIPLCGVKHFLRFDCPGCGMTTSISELLHGHIRASIDAHPLGIVIALWFAYMFLRAVASVLLGRRIKPLLTQAQRDLLMYVFLAALLIQWIVKIVLA
ncbi:MAG: DUF2752 domain-containing protein [Deltaproteobacteria bacterium]|nr:DUF2752 domain-containing protein [Deltaproteobacteria bacterium]